MNRLLIDFLQDFFQFLGIYTFVSFLSNFFGNDFKEKRKRINLLKDKYYEKEEK